MTTSLERIAQDENLQKHWMLRCLATLIDVVLIFTPVWVSMALFGWLTGIQFYMGGLTSGIIWFGYCVFLEYGAKTTLGKVALGLRVTSTQGPLEMSAIMIRNLTKIFGLLLIIDIILAMLTDGGDHRQRYMDRIAKTVVVSERKVL